MSDPEDDAITPVTADGLARIAARGIWTAGPAVEPAVAGVAEALIATLQGTVDRQVLPDDLQRLAEYVRRTAKIDAPWITAADGARLSAFSIRLETDEPRPLVGGSSNCGAEVGAQAGDVVGKAHGNLGVHAGKQKAPRPPLSERRKA